MLDERQALQRHIGIWTKEVSECLPSREGSRRWTLRSSVRSHAKVVELLMKKALPMSGTVKRPELLAAKVARLAMAEDEEERPSANSASQH